MELAIISAVIIRKINLHHKSNYNWKNRFLFKEE